ncbi:MAG: hypothetical protein DRN05_02125 [Thermoplasmata archaeon]|nr:MAG: hypothetical protein DRN05_02125 [Thermoplasmata archaeon]
MKVFYPILLAGILVLGSFGAAALSDGDVKQMRITVSFQQPILEEQGECIKVSLDNANSVLMKPHKPVLPAYVKKIVFPFGTEIKHVSCKVHNIKQKTVSKELISAPEPVLAGIDTIDAVWKKKQETVYDNSPFPDKLYEYDVGCGLQGEKRNVIVKIKVFPVQYIPEKKTINWASDVEIEIEYKEPQHPFVFDDEYPLVVIGPEEFSNELTPLISHKNSNGISSIFVSLDDIYNGIYFPAEGRDDQEKIKYFIKNAIENWGTSYVLLVGGSQKLPVRTTHVHIDSSPPDNEVFVSDLYYADIYNETGGFCSWDSNGNNVFGEYNWGNSHLTDEIDLYPDVYLGRLACINENEVETAVNKIIAYENNQAYTQDWFTNLVVCGGDSFPGDNNGVDEGEFVNQAVIDIMDGFIPDKIWASNGRLTGMFPTGAQEISEAINSGAGFVDFSGHGNTYVWATHPHEDHNTWIPTPMGGYLNSPHVTGLSNGNKLPIIAIGACSTSKFNSDSDCFAWSFISNPNGGGIGTFGAAALGWAYMGEWVTSGLIEGMVIKTFEAYKEESATTFGEMWGRAIINYISPGMEDVDYKTVEEWEPLGDPSLAIAGQSQAPEKPAKPSGPTSGRIRKTYTYSSTTTDPDNDQIYYLFDWGDGSYSGWLGPYSSGDTVEASHTWTKRGTYEIRVKAKDEHGVQSEWSDPLPVSMPRGKMLFYQHFLYLIEKIFPRIYLFIQYLLENTGYH